MNSGRPGPEPPDHRRHRRHSPRGRAALPGGLDGVGRSGHAGAPGGDARHRVHRPRLPGRLGLEGVREGGDRARDDACPRVSSMPSGCPSRSSPPRPRPRSGSKDLNIGMAEAADLVGQRDRRGSAGPLPRRLPPGCGTGRGAGHHHRRHQVRARLHRREAGHLRRGADPGLLAVLARRRLRTRAPTRPPSTSNRCATGSRHSPGTSSRRRRRFRPRSWTETSRALRRRPTSGSAGVA